MRAHAIEMVFPIGQPNDAFAQYFIGKNYFAPVSTEQVGIFNVTFEPGCRNNWHIYHTLEVGGQILVSVAGRGYYQEWGGGCCGNEPGRLRKYSSRGEYQNGGYDESMIVYGCSCLVFVLSLVVRFPDLLWLWEQLSQTCQVSFPWIITSTIIYRALWGT